ncbi:MAG: hypothetical protein MK101_02585 [Phycisphaerales bacterium]|nr:hypothetical protein [Phycisphaerales bacterium]
MLVSTLMLPILGLSLSATPEHEVPVRLTSVRTLEVVISPSTSSAVVRSGVRNCPQEIATHTDSDFGPGEYIVQAGFEQQEAAAASYLLPASAFPIHFNSAEILFATAGATTQTTTEWSFELWAGDPGNGTLMHTFASDGSIIPHLVMPPGTTGTIVQLVIDPGDPEQIFIDDNGSHTYTVAFRIEAHHTPGYPCVEPPSQTQNAFPTTDMSGVASMSGNWIDAIDGAFCFCGVGWFSFGSFPSICTPSGDWVLRSTFTPWECNAAEGACCFDDGSCQTHTEVNCVTLDGTFAGAGIDCDAADCQAAPGACCVEATGACLEVDEVTCTGFGGEFHPDESCSTFVCFPEGACCLADGNCTGPVSDEVCTGFGGMFMGDGSDCSVVDCPDPVGWCCADDGFCADLNEGQCFLFDGVWGGAGTSCDDPDACGQTDCPGDVDGNGQVDVDDILVIISNWDSSGEGDANGDGTVDVNDLLMVIGNYGDC